MQVQNNTWLDTIHTLYRCSQARKRACAVQKGRTSPMLGRLLVDDRSNGRCSCTKDVYSALHASTSFPLVYPFSKIPSKSLLNSWRGAKSSPPTTNAAHTQLIPCPMKTLESTVDCNQFEKSSMKRRASRRNSVRNYWLPIWLSFVSRRIPERKFFSSIAQNRE